MEEAIELLRQAKARFEYERDYMIHMEDHDGWHDLNILVEGVELVIEAAANTNLIY